jgi:lipoate synthase
MQHLEQFKLIEATKDLIETVNQRRSTLESRQGWRYTLALALLRMAQRLEPNVLTQAKPWKVRHFARVAR